MVQLERYLGKYVMMLVHSYNPDRYVRLMEEDWRTYIRFFFLTLAVALLLFVFTFVPMAIKWIGGLPATLEEVDTFRVDGEITADHPVVLLDVPRIVLDLNGTSEAKLLFTRAGVEYPAYGFFGRDVAVWDDLTDLKRKTTTRDRLLLGIVLFMLPSILFWVALWSILKLVLVFFLLVMAGYTLPRFLKHRMSFTETLKASVLAMPSVMLFGVGLSPLAPRPLWWWGLALTVGFFAVGVFLLSERVKGKV